MTTWKAWSLDAATWAFIAWWVWFLAWEFVAILSDHYEGTWTAHFRPVFNEASITWFLGVGFYLWFGLHIFAPRFEAWILEAIKLPPAGL